MGTIGDQQLSSLSGTGTIGDRLRASAASSAFSGTLDDLGQKLGTLSVAPSTPSVVGTTQTDGVASADPTRSIFTIPAAAQTGDWMIFFTASRHSADTHSISTGGSTIREISSSGGSQMSLAVHVYEITGADTPGTTTVTVSSNQTFVSFSATATLVTGISGVDVSAQNTPAFANTITVPSLTTSADNAIVFFAGSMPRAVDFTSTGNTELADFETGTACMAVYTKDAPTAGATGTDTITAVDTGSGDTDFGYCIAVALAN